MLRFIPGLFIRLSRGAEPQEGYEPNAYRTWFLRFLKSPSQMGFHLVGFLSGRYADSVRSGWRNLLVIDRRPLRLGRSRRPRSSVCRAGHDSSNRSNDQLAVFVCVVLVSVCEVFEFRVPCVDVVWCLWGRQYLCGFVWRGPLTDVFNVLFL